MLHLIIKSIIEEVKDVRSYTLASEDGTDISYKPGQFITLVKHHAGKEIRRSYSMSSITGEPLTITLKRIENGYMSRFLFDEARVGTIIQALEPAGLFTLPDGIYKYEQVFFFAAGSGITPIYSLIKYILYNLPHIAIVLVYSNKSKETTLFHDALTNLANTHKARFTLHFVYSNIQNAVIARLNKQGTTRLYRQYLKVPVSNTSAYICGPLPYMLMTGYGLEEAGLPHENIRKEIFSFQKKTIKRQPPNQDMHPIFLTLQKHKYTFTSQYPQTILHAALKNGIHLPYSCETGQCGSCALKCISGSVWMSNNEVLTQADEAKGLILTCTGYAISALELQI